MNEQQFKRLSPQVVLQGTVLLAAPVIAVVLFSVGSPALGFIAALLPFGLLTATRPDLMLVVVFWLSYSKLRLPGMPGKLMAIHALLMVVLTIVLARGTILKTKGRTRGAMWGWILAFAAVLVFTIMARGTGFRMLGDHNWGGTRYVNLFLTMSCVYIASQVRLRESYWRVALTGMVFLSFLPFISDLVFAFTHGAFYYLYYIVEYGSGMADSFESFESGGLTRFQSARLSGPLLFMFPFLFYPFKGKYRWLYAGCMLTGLALAGISGHRLAILRILAFCWLFGFLISKGARVRFALTSIAVGILLLIPLVLFAEHLPLSFQRSLSWIPWADVGYEARYSADSTVAWRLNVWNLALAEIPRYWLVGKGYTFNYNELLAFMHLPHAGTEWARITVAYHSGPLSLLIGMGVTGLVVGFGVLLAASGRHYRLVKMQWHSPSLKRMHMILFRKFN